MIIELSHARLKIISSAYDTNPDPGVAWKRVLSCESMKNENENEIEKEKEKEKKGRKERKEAERLSVKNDLSIKVS